MQIFPSQYKVHKIYGQILITENQKMGRKNFFRGFYHQGKNQPLKGSKVKNLLVKRLIKISIGSAPPRIQRSNHFFIRILPSSKKLYGETLITEYRKTGRENFNPFFMRNFPSRYKAYKIHGQTLITEYRENFSFGFCLIKIRIELFNFHSKQPIKDPKVNDHGP